MLTSFFSIYYLKVLHLCSSSSPSHLSLFTRKQCFAIHDNSILRKLDENFATCYQSNVKKRHHVPGQEIYKKYIKPISERILFQLCNVHCCKQGNLRKFKLGKGLLVEVKSTQTGIMNSIHPKAWPK